jgi:hypothetical protein
MRAPFGRRFRMFATARVTAELRAGRENLPLDLFQFLTGAGHKFNGRTIQNKVHRGNFLKLPSPPWFLFRCRANGCVN